MGRPRKNVETNEAAGSEEIAERPEGYFPMHIFNSAGFILVEDEEEEEIALKSGFVYSPAEVK